MTRNTIPEPPAAKSPPLPPAPRHPVGLLYTLLRHGRGLSHDEAARRSKESVAAKPRLAA